MVKRRSSRFGRIHEKESVSDLTSSVWRTAYVAAILEPDAAKMDVRISDARNAINERLASLAEIAPLEQEALKLLNRDLRI
jgi:hypothetical protein